MHLFVTILAGRIISNEPYLREEKLSQSFSSLQSLRDPRRKPKQKNALPKPLLPDFEGQSEIRSGGEM